MCIHLPHYLERKAAIFDNIQATFSYILYLYVAAYAYIHIHIYKYTQDVRGF